MEGADPSANLTWEKAANAFRVAFKDLFEHDRATSTSGAATRKYATQDGVYTERQAETHSVHRTFETSRITTMRETTSTNAKVAIMTALITAGATVLTSFIGIVPQMRRGDQTRIDQLSKQTDDLKAKVAGLQTSAGLFKVSGQVRNKSNAPIKDAVLYAASADDSAPLDDNGTFLFQNMSRKPYWVVLANQGGTVHRLLINPDDPNPSTDSEDVVITYAFSPE